MGRRSDKIAQRKGKSDAAKAKVYGRIGKKIIQYVKSGGADPSTNSRLSDLLKQAKEAGVPKDIIDRNIKRAADKNQTDYQEILYEAYGPGGTGFVIECLTDNPNRTASDVKNAINKGGAKVAESGSVLFNFSRQGQLWILSDNEDAVFEAAMEAGAEDIQPVPDEEGNASKAFKVFIAADMFSDARSAITSAGLSVDPEASDLVYRAPAAVEVDDEAFTKCEGLMERLLELDDVDAVYTNCDGLAV